MQLQIQHRERSFSGSWWRLLMIVIAMIMLLAVSLLARPLPAAAFGSGQLLATELVGAQEVPGPGDPDGQGLAFLWLDPDQGQICYLLLAFNIEPATAAHIHLAPAGTAGPVVVPLNPPTEGFSFGCAMDVSQDLIMAIMDTPEQYYVNVHNAPYPAGAIRGQLD